VLADDSARKFIAEFNPIESGFKFVTVSSGLFCFLPAAHLAAITEVQQE